MTCAGCQKRREAIARMAARLGGTIVFGAKRVLAKPEVKQQQEAATRGKPGA
jgi:hypothetical protein